MLSRILQALLGALVQGALRALRDWQHRRALRRQGRREAQLDQAREAHDAKADDAQRWADRPRNPDALARRLRAAADARRDRADDA